MTEPRPLASIVIANYNYGEFLPETLETVLAQTYQPIEIVVVDDGSTDDSREVLARYPLHAIYQENAGQAAALDVGVASARGEIICLLDADDGWDARKVERVVQILTRHPDVQWVRHELEVVDRWRRPLGPKLPHIRRSGPLPPSPAAVAERVVVASTSAITFRRAAARSVFPLPVRTHLRFDADALIVAGLGSRFRGWQLAETLGFYRRHERQQYACEADLERMIERQIEVGTLIAESLGRAEPVTNYKHRAILAALRGRPRRAEVLRGLVASLRLVSHPMIMARQAAALLYAGTAPDLWLGKIRRFQGFQ